MADSGQRKTGASKRVVSAPTSPGASGLCASEGGSACASLGMKRKQVIANYSFTILTLALCLIVLTFVSLFSEVKSDTNQSVRRVLSPGVQTKDLEQKSAAAARQRQHQQQQHQEYAQEASSHVSKREDDNQPLGDTLVGSASAAHSDDTKQQVHDTPDRGTHSSEVHESPSTTTTAAAAAAAAAAKSTAALPEKVLENSLPSATSKPPPRAATKSSASDAIAAAAADANNRQTRATTRRRQASSSTTTPTSNLASSTQSSTTTTTPATTTTSSFGATSSTAQVAASLSDSEPGTGGSSRSSSGGKLTKQYQDEDLDEADAAAEAAEAERAAERARRRKLKKTRSKQAGQTVESSPVSSSTPTDSVSLGSLPTRSRQRERLTTPAGDSSSKDEQLTAQAHRGAKHGAATAASGLHHHNRNNSHEHTGPLDGWETSGRTREPLASGGEADENEEYEDYDATGGAAASKRTTASSRWSSDKSAPTSKTSEAPDLAKVKLADMADHWNESTSSGGARNKSRHHSAAGDKLHATKASHDDELDELKAATTPDTQVAATIGLDGQQKQRQDDERAPASTPVSPLDARSPGIGKRLTDMLTEQKNKFNRQPAMVAAPTTSLTVPASSAAKLAHISSKPPQPSSSTTKAPAQATSYPSSSTTSFKLPSTESSSYPAIEPATGTTPLPAASSASAAVNATQPMMQQQPAPAEQPKFGPNGQLGNQTEPSAWTTSSDKSIGAGAPAGGSSGGLTNDTMASELLDWSKLVKVMFKSAKDNQTVYTVVMNSSELTNYPISDWSSELAGLLRKDFEKLIQKWLNVFRVDHLKANLATLVPDKHLVNVSLISQQAPPLPPVSTNQSSSPLAPIDLSAAQQQQQQTMPPPPPPPSVTANDSLPAVSLNKSETFSGATSETLTSSLPVASNQTLAPGSGAGEGGNGAGSTVSLNANNSSTSSLPVANGLQANRTNGTTIASRTSTTTQIQPPIAAATTTAAAAAGNSTALHLLGQIHHNTEQVTSLRHFMIVCSISVVIATSLIVALIFVLFK